MSIIDKILIVLDEDKDYSLDELVNIFKDQYSKQVVSASMGRIITKKLVKKTKNIFSITEKGSNIITLNLNNIQKLSERKSIDSYIFITFNVPEKDRIKRDKFRNYLITNGYGRLNNTFWLGLNKNIEDIKKFIKKHDLINNSLVFETKKISNYLDVLNHTKWNTSLLDKEYTSFINQANIFLKSKKDKYTARFLVYLFSKICKKDPMLPENILIKDYKGFKALNIYNKIRKYCY